MKSLVKALVLSAVLISGAVTLTSCGTPFPLGCLYTNVWMPGAIGDGEVDYNRMGYSSCYNFLGWFAGGNASHNIAAKNGDINKISWTTLHIENYLGIFGRYTNVVYGIGDKADPTVRTIADIQ